MPAYLVVAHKITDAAKFEEYRSKVAPMIAHFGGRSNGLLRSQQPVGAGAGGPY